MVKESEDLVMYFPDMVGDQLPERSFLFSILTSLRPQELKSLVEDARRNRSVIHKPSEDELIAFLPNVRDEVFKILPQKSEWF